MCVSCILCRMHILIINQAYRVDILFVCRRLKNIFVRQSIYFKLVIIILRQKHLKITIFFHKKRFFIFRTFLSCSENLNCKKAFT